MSNEPLWSMDKWWHEVQQVKGTANIAGNNVDYIELADAEELFEKIIADYKQRIAELEGEIAEQQSSFELRWDADMRAIQQWQEATGKELQLPNHTDLCVWLMRQLDNAQAELARLRDAWRISDANLTGDLEMSAEKIRKLEAELARLREQQWEPLPVGSTLSIDNATMAVSNDILSVIYDVGDDGDVEVMTWDLPASIRLCRKVYAQPKESNNHE